MRINYQIIAYYLIALCLISCASIVAPTGGPKDTTPPIVLGYEPANYSTEFNSKRISITFNEYVKLNNIENKTIISPLQKEIPEYNLKGKSLIVKLKDTLKSNTTYTFSFGNAIADITENNAMNELNYVVSTGNTIDSGAYYGKVINSFTIKPEKDIFVMLYNLNIDSLPYKTRPVYIARTNVNGQFKFNNILPGNYKIFALKDNNSNYLYDLPNEQIAFKENPIKTEIFKSKPLNIINKKIKTDTLTKKTEVILAPKNIDTLYLFQENDSIQKVLKANLINTKQIQVAFKYPTINPEFISLKNDFILSDIIKEFSSKRDTINIWLKNYSKDSIYMIIKDKNKILDTVKLGVLSKHNTLVSKNKSKKTPVLGYKINISNNKAFDYYRNISLVLNAPIKEYDFSKLILTETKDTIKPKIKFKDSLQRKLDISYRWKEGQDYTLKIMPNTFKDINDLTNDTIKLSFKTTEAKNYSSIVLKLKLHNRDINYIFQLLDEQGKNIIKETDIKTGNKIKFEYLQSTKYQLKVIFDANHNNRWDTGSYQRKLQSEKILFFNKEILCKPNWDTEIEWSL